MGAVGKSNHYRGVNGGRSFCRVSTQLKQNSPQRLPRLPCLRGSDFPMRCSDNEIQMFSSGCCNRPRSDIAKGTMAGDTA